MTERLDIDGLRALQAIGLYGGVTKAAQRLCLSQSAVSHKIKRLETALDCTLLARKASGPLFTETGTRLNAYATRILQLHDEALADLNNTQVQGTIRLGMTEDAATSKVSEVLGRFSQLQPSVFVQTRSSQSLNLQDWLRTGALDVAVMQIFDADLESDDQVLFSEALHWVKSPEFELDLSRPVPFLSFDENCFYRQWGFSKDLPDGISLQTVFECPSAAGVRSGVCARLGVALLNESHVLDEMEIVQDIFPQPPAITFVTRTHPQRKTPAVSALTAEIIRAFRR